MIVYYNKYNYNKRNRPREKCLICGSIDVVSDLFVDTSVIAESGVKVIGYLCRKHLKYFEGVTNDTRFMYKIPDYIPEKQYIKYLRKIILKEVTLKKSVPLKT